MDKRKVANELMKLAQGLDADAGYDFSRVDPSLNVLAARVARETGGDLSMMATVMVMALRKAGQQQAANKVFTIFRPFLKRVERQLGL